MSHVNCNLGSARFITLFLSRKYRTTIGRFMAPVASSWLLNHCLLSNQHTLKCLMTYFVELIEEKILGLRQIFSVLTSLTSILRVKREEWYMRATGGYTCPYNLTRFKPQPWPTRSLERAWFLSTFSKYTVRSEKSEP